ncbi:MAG: glycosyltransferase family 4 protein [Anaerolineae bacterium]|nr:glycosyltransferase family 4 protein [Anaerolineae bacterium]MDW8173639.1 glycosyltransferase family 4 protein [Anaerolineae bacterium]
MTTTTRWRILMLSKACVVGIYQRKLEAIARHDDIELRVLVPPSWRDERGVQALERVYTQGYDLHTIPIALNGNFHLHFYPTLGREMRAFRPHLVHIDEEPYNLAAWQALAWARHLRAKSLFFSWQNILRRYPPPFAWGERWVLRHVDGALMGTESAAQVWHDKGYRGTLAIVPQFGTDPQLFQPRPRPTGQPFTIGYVGRLVEEKGLFVLLNALAQLPQDKPWRVHLIGGGPLRPALEQQGQTLGLAERLHFVGQVASTAMPQAMNALDTLVLPSLTRPNWKEQFGRALIEAMASGLPVIGSTSGAIPDVIGEAGLIVPEGDAPALAAALRHLMDDPTARARLGQQGRARVLAHFTHDEIAEATVTFYRALLKLPQLSTYQATVIRPSAS